MNIEIYRFKKLEGSYQTKAFFDIILDNTIIIKGFKLVEGKSGLFLACPSEKNKDGSYYDLVRFNTSESKDFIEKLAITKYTENPKG